MNRKVLALICIISMAAVLHAEKSYTYTLHGITFDSNVEFSLPVNAGVDALQMFHPRHAGPGKEKMGITAVLYDRNAQKMMGLGDTGLLNYTRTVFMGSATPGKPIERVFAGKKVTGQALNKKIPVPTTVEVYVITLSNGNKIGIGFNYTSQLKAEDAQRIIAGIGASMRE